MTPETQKIYDSIVTSISILDRDGILQDLHGNCVLASDIIQNMLYDQGISSTIVECQLTISKLEKDGTTSVNFVGYDFSPVYNQISTHAMVMTRSDPPLIVDASIGHYLGNVRQVVITECNPDTDNPDILGSSKFDQFTLTYRNKKNIKLASRHQKDIVDRLKHEYDNMKNIRMLRYLVIGTVFFSLTNFLLNITILTIKLFEKL
jgi:hypothetical protein